MDVFEPVIMPSPFDFERQSNDWPDDFHGFFTLSRRRPGPL
jgi:hypothetical protein